MKFLCYSRCSTCKKAAQYLTDLGITAETQDLKADRPSAAQLEKLYQKSGLPLKRFFNTSGQVYRRLNLKDRLQEMTEQEQIELLASDGMLVKRPILEGKDFVLIGFKVDEWAKQLQ